MRTEKRCAQKRRGAIHVDVKTSPCCREATCRREGITVLDICVTEAAGQGRLGTDHRDMMEMRLLIEKEKESWQ